MTDKEVKHMNRAQLLSLLAEVTRENEALRSETARMREEIAALTVTNEKLEAIGDLSREILAAVNAQANREPQASETPAPAMKSPTEESVSLRETAAPDHRSAAAEPTENAAKRFRWLNRSRS